MLSAGEEASLNIQKNGKGIYCMDPIEDPRLFREEVRREKWTESTSGCCRGYVQANLVVVPKAAAFDFLLFCLRNPKPCPVLEVTEVGDPILKGIAPGADLCTDLPAYRVYSHGKCVEELTNLKAVWKDDLVGFLLGCSYTFDAALHNAGLPVPHFLEGKDVGIYRTTIACEPAGMFSGPLVVTARAIPMTKVVLAIEITSRLKQVHGSPVHVGDPGIIGIRDLSTPDYSDSPLKPREDEIVLFWACGVTPQAVGIHSKVPLMITHKPGHMFVSDLTIEGLLAEK